jgi:hypothetical protein
MTTPLDEQIAQANRLMREHIAPSINHDQGAGLLLFHMNGKGIMTWISTCERATMREALRELLLKWDAEGE